jgi:hypothetical protein
MVYPRPLERERIVNHVLALCRLEPADAGNRCRAAFALLFSLLFGEVTQRSQQLNPDLLSRRAGDAQRRSAKGRSGNPRGHSIRNPHAWRIALRGWAKMRCIGARACFETRLGCAGPLLRMSNFLNLIKVLPHAEECREGASRSTHSIAAAMVAPRTVNFADSLLRDDKGLY